MRIRRAPAIIAVAAALLGWSQPLAAQDVDAPIAVVELFTSQGCNSCPKADALLNDLAERGDVVALAYHVDYWDYLGWKDTLAMPENTERQRDYSSIFENRSVYTPQIVINGTAEVKGSKPARVESALKSAETSGSLPIKVELALTTDSLVVDIGAGEAPAEAAILLVYFSERSNVSITQGKNRGSAFSYQHSVAGFHSAGMWQGTPQHFRMPLHDVRKKGSGGVAVIVQEIARNGLPGRIRGAALIHHPAGS